MSEECVTLYKSDALVLDQLSSSMDLKADKRYCEIGSIPASQLTALFQFAPANAIAQSSSGLFRIQYPNGVAGYLSRHGNGYLSSLHDFDTGKIIDHATYVPVEKSFTLFKTFQALSIITSQYYLHEINQQLSEIQNKLDRVLDFLYDDKSCEIYSYAKTVFGIYTNYSVIMKSETHRSSSLVLVQSAKIVAEKNIQFYYRDMNRIVSSLDGKGSSKNESAINNLRDDLSNYNQSMNLYGICTILEILLSQSFEKSYLESLHEELKSHINVHNIVVSKLQGKLEQIDTVQARAVLKRNSPHLDELISNVEELISEKSPVKDFEKIALELKEAFTAPSEYLIQNDGFVYKKIA